MFLSSEHKKLKRSTFITISSPKKHHIYEWNTQLTPILRLVWTWVWLQGKNLSLNMCVKPTEYLVCDQNYPTIQCSFSLFNISYNFQRYIFNGVTNNKIWNSFEQWMAEKVRDQTFLLLRSTAVSSSVPIELRNALKDPLRENCLLIMPELKMWQIQLYTDKFAIKWDHS